MRNVLVLDANQRSALAIIRSLGRRGLTVIAADMDARTLGGASRFASKSLRYSDPANAPNAFLADVYAIVERFNIGTIIPATDLTTMLLLSQSSLPHNAMIAAPTLPSYEALTDKARLVEIAQTLGIKIPMTRIAATRQEIFEASREIGFPVVLKPARSRYLRQGKVISTGVEIVQEIDQIAERMEHCQWIDDIPCLVQQFVPGHGAGVFSLCSSIGPVGWFAHRRIREKPPTGGVSVLSESTIVDPVMQAAAAKLLNAAHWFGVAMVEFRIGKDGTPYLMEVNGRFWGSLQLAIDCGFDFPWLLYQIAHGRVTPSMPSYDTGRRLRWLLGDLDSLLIDLRGGRLSMGQKAVAISRFFAAFVDFRCRQEVLRISDPIPGVREVARWLKNR